MALVLADRVRDTTTTTSTGTITLSGTAPTGFQNFSVIGNGNTTYYTIAHQTANEWEVGIGTYTSSGTTLARTTILASSNSGSVVNLSAGTKDVFVTYPAERSVNLSSAALTSGRVPYATTDGLLVDAANLTFNGTTLTANTIGAFTLSGTVAGGGNQLNNVIIGTSTPLAGNFTTVSATTSVTTPSVTNAGTLALAATGANIMTASTNGSERMRIDSSGNVGIGTSSPAANSVTIASKNVAMTSGFGMSWNSSATQLAGYDTNILQFITASTERMRIDSSGNVGIGATSPSAKLHSYATSGTTTTLGRFEAAIGSYTGTSLIAANTLSASSTYNLFSCITDSDGDAGGPFTQFLVRGDGNVGIGTSSPSSPLNVVSASSSLAIAINGRSSDNLGGMYFYANNGSTQYATLTASATEFRLSSVPAAAVQTFYTNGSERMRIDSSGNLLIGTSTSPAGSKELVLGGDYIEAVVAIGTVTTTNTISLANGTLQTATLTASTACTFTMPTAIAGKSFTLLLKQAASTGNGTATFTSVKWGTAGAPTITATAGKMDILTFVSDGTNWYGSIAQGYTP